MGKAHYPHIMSNNAVPKVLSIAGSDSGGGAGIQADIKAFARCGVHGMTAVTAVTAQNTVEVKAAYELPPDLIIAQVAAVSDDIGVDAVKVGMLSSERVIDAVAKALDLVGRAPVVVDPVMVAESGARLLERSAVRALVERLFPRAAVVTPNLHEAEAVLGLDDRCQPEEIAKQLLDLGPAAVVITGGHSGDGADDLFYDGDCLEWIKGERFESGAAHGSGCTHSSALAAYLARGLSPLDAAREAKRVASEAVRNGLATVGSGAGPVDVFGLQSIDR